MVALFSADVVALLNANKLGDMPGLEALGVVTYATDPDGARMGKAGEGTFTTVEIKDVYSARNALLNASLGSLLNRQDMYGTILRYPRTLVLGPDSAFAGKKLLPVNRYWKEDVSAAQTVISVRDFDQIIWVNHWVGSTGMVQGESNPAVEINVATFDHAMRSAVTLNVALHRSRFNGTIEGAEFGQTIADQFVAVMKNLGAPSLTPDERRTTPGYSYNVAPPAEAAAYVIAPTPPPSKYDVEYIKHAVAALERVMRGSVFSHPKRVRTPAQLLGPNTGDYATHPGLVYTAVLSGVVPYGIHDIVDAKKHRPAPIPGAAPPERIIDVMTHLLGYKPGGDSTPSSSSRTSAAISSSPYGALASAMRADTAAAGDNVSPYALVSASLARNAAGASVSYGDDLGFGLAAGMGLDEDDMSSSDEDGADYSSDF